MQDHVEYYNSAMPLHKIKDGESETESDAGSSSGASSIDASTYASSSGRSKTQGQGAKKKKRKEYRTKLREREAAIRDEERQRTGQRTYAAANDRHSKKLVGYWNRASVDIAYMMFESMRGKHITGIKENPQGAYSAGTYLPWEQRSLDDTPPECPFPHFKNVNKPLIIALCERIVCHYVYLRKLEKYNNKESDCISFDRICSHKKAECEGLEFEQLRKWTYYHAVYHDINTESWRSQNIEDMNPTQYKSRALAQYDFSINNVGLDPYTTTKDGQPKHTEWYDLKKWMDKSPEQFFEERQQIQGWQWLETHGPYKPKSWLLGGSPPHVIEATRGLADDEYVTTRLPTTHDSPYPDFEIRRNK